MNYQIPIQEDDILFIVLLTPLGLINVWDTNAIELNRSEMYVMIILHFIGMSVIPMIDETKFPL